MLLWIVIRWRGPVPGPGRGKRGERFFTPGAEPGPIHLPSLEHAQFVPPTTEVLIANALRAGDAALRLGWVPPQLDS